MSRFRNDKRRGFIKVLIGLAVALSLSHCSSKPMKAEGSREILKLDEFEKRIEIEAINGGEPRSAGDSSAPSANQNSPGAAGSGKNVNDPKDVNSVVKAPPAVRVSDVESSKALVSKKKKKSRGRENESLTDSLAAVGKSPVRHEPSIEDGEGFEGRRPKVDPFVVGEKITYDVSYFGVSAGEMTLEVRPFVRVNGRKSYHFLGAVKSSSVFAMFYAVDDWFEAFMDYETMTPTSYALHVTESKQLRETRSLFDWQKSVATVWDKKINAEKQVEERNFEWSIPAYAQNIFTSPFYLRAFQLAPGKKLAYFVSHEKENLSFTGEVLRREKLKTPLGELKTVVVKPKIELNGHFRPVGDIFIWLTDDERKYIVRIESKIQIGTIVTAIKALQPGQP